ncbi:MAG: isoamylase early set domain-containing protein [Acidimicrobiia bacterium]
MIKKTPAKQGETTKVTFEYPGDMGAREVNLCGEFNDWSSVSTPLARRKGGQFSVSLNFKQGRSYRFRYLVDGHQWENDPEADGYEANGYGTEDSVIRL